MFNPKVLLILLLDSLLTDSRPSVTSGLTSDSAPYALDDSNSMEKHTNNSSDERCVGRNNEVLATDVFTMASSSLEEGTSDQVS